MNMPLNNNPLKQYFRRPAIYLKLPSNGDFYPAGSIDLPENKEVPVYPMTAIDEITSKTPDALFNGSAIVDIIKSCVPNIKDPWAVPNTDLDPILVAIRAATNGNQLDIESTCPQCKEESSYAVNLVALLSKLESGNYDELAKIDDLSFKFNPLSYQQVTKLNLAQFEIEREINALNNITDDDARSRESSISIQKLKMLGMELIANSIEFIATPSASVADKAYILDYLRNCDRNTYEKLRAIAINLREKSQIKPIDIKCIECGHEYDQLLTLNVSDFFE